MPLHGLTIRRFSTRLGYTGAADDGAALQRSLAALIRERLPIALQRVLDPALAHREGVLRIRQIRLSLNLLREDCGVEQLAAQLAGQLSQQLLQAAGRPGNPGDVAWWPDHAHFAAAYLSHRLGLRPEPDWAFGDFQALDYLDTQQALCELTAARPAILAALARLRGLDSPTRLVDRIGESMAQTLMSAVLSRHNAADVLADFERLRQLLDALPADRHDRPASAALSAALLWLASDVKHDSEVIIAVVAQARLASVLRAVDAHCRHTLGRPLQSEDLLPGALLELPPTLAAFAVPVLAEPTASAANRRHLAHWLASVSERADASADARDTGPRQRDKRQAALPHERLLRSRLAGVGLLLPAALQHELPTLLSAAALHRVLVAALAADEREAARLDPLIAELAPFDPRQDEPSFPPVPELLRAVVPDSLKATVATREGAVGWASCLVHAFAAGLPGFENSSLAYLRQQFLARPGTLQIRSSRMELRLDAMPLSIVLRMAGLHGWSRPLPHAGNRALKLLIAAE